jgi:hypothetical protein
MPAGPGAAHERQEEVAEREIDVGEFDDFHALTGLRFRYYR